MHPFRFLLLASLILCASMPLRAQGTATVVGRVTDALTGQAVPFASAALYSVRDSSIAGGALAGEDGAFEIVGIGRGRYWCTVSFIGYGTWTSEPFGFGPQGPQRKDLGAIVLEPSVEALDEAEVVAEQSTMEMLIDRRVFHVGSDLTSAGANASELLTRVPSVSVDLDGNVSLRGSSNVQILIDGRPSGLSGAAGQAFLAQIPSQTIDRVEIITNPSARYDPDGMAGILNIVLKKNKLAGFNGTVQITPATAGNVSSSASLNYRDAHWSVFSSLSANRRNRFAGGSFLREQVLYDSTQTLTQVRGGNDIDLSIGGRVGVEWMPSEGTVWSLSSNFNRSTEDEFESRTNDLVWGSEEANTVRLNYETGVQSGWDLDGGFRKTFDGNPQHTFEATLRWSESHGDSNQDIHEENTDDPTLEFDDFNDQITHNARQVLAIDYVRPLPESGKLELGWKSNLSDQSSQFTYVEPDSTTYAGGLYLPWGLDTVDYTFNYREDVHAVYGTWGRDWGAWGAQIGSRLEQAYTRAQLSGPGSTPFQNDYFSWYPSANLSYEADDRTTWSLSYSRRVNRPRGRQVNPYVDDSDAFNVRTGNPELRPEYTHSFEINRLWTRDRWSISTALFHKRTTDVIRHYSTIDENGVRQSSFINLSSRHDEGLEVILSAPLWKASSMRLTGDVYHLSNDAGDLEAATNAQGWTYNLSLFANLALGKEWKGQINGMHRGASVTPQGRFNGIQWLDVAVQRTLLDRRLSLALRVSDVFDTRQWSYAIDLPDFHQESVHKRQSRFAYLDLRWNFGKLEEGRRGRSGGGGGGGDFDGGEF